MPFYGVWEKNRVWNQAQKHFSYMYLFLSVILGHFAVLGRTE